MVTWCLEENCCSALSVQGVLPSLDWGGMMIWSTAPWCTTIRPPSSVRGVQCLETPCMTWLVKAEKSCNSGNPWSGNTLGILETFWPKSYAVLSNFGIHCHFCTFVTIFRLNVEIIFYDWERLGNIDLKILLFNCTCTCCPQFWFEESPCTFLSSVSGLFRKVILKEFNFDRPGT